MAETKEPTESSGSNPLPNVRAPHPPRIKALTPRKPRRRRLKAKDIEEAEKMARVLDERKQGVTFDVIAERNGFYDASGASKFCKRALEFVVQESAEEVRKLEIERYDRWLLALEPKVHDGDPRAIEQAIKVSDRRAALMGLDAPAQTEITVNANARTMHLTLDTKRPEVLGAVHDILRLRPAQSKEVDAEATAVEEPREVQDPPEAQEADVVGEPND